MQSAADVNERLGVVGHGDMTGIIMDQGATVSEADIGSGRYGQPTEETKTPALTTAETDPITIGEALEATALSAGDKPIDASDAAAIQAAEVRATGLGHVVPGGIAAEAQSAAAHNILTTREEDKTKLADVLVDATAKLTVDKPVTREDAEGVISAEIRNKPELATHPGGVAASVAAAARLNEQQ
ncbi:UNVERIFIED_CONTAM: Late embryogenesis abundant protein D-34 [Sesamum radiatum]|uniref:Late embryogenesis abundant protein D-34 n=1 Tax=Sesamum radiatum TaxID=300843 RepID=A0AAW2UPC5_SESRA